MYWAELSLIVTAGLFVLDQVLDLGPFATIALLVVAVLYVVFRNSQENGSRTASLALLVLAGVGALELLDSAIPVLRIS